MRGLLFPLTIALAVAATGGLALLAFRDRPQPEPGATGPTGDSDLIEERQRAARAPVLRLYQTTATLAEDLRDALAGDAAALEQEVWRVSKAFKSRALWTLLNVARDEASPKVRALLVIAAGVHAPDDELLLAFLEDRWPIVRRATVLAAGYKPDGATKVKLVGGLDVPVGRALSDSTETLLRSRLGEEQDAAVRDDLEAVLSR